MSVSTDKYSRQTAAYGEQCAKKIFSSVCVVAWHAQTSNAVLAETLKNLALSGVREICLIDDGSQLDAEVMDVSSTSLFHTHVRAAQEASTASLLRDQHHDGGVVGRHCYPRCSSLCAAMRQGILELNDSIHVSTIDVSTNSDGDADSSSSSSSSSWFGKIEQAVVRKFDLGGHSTNKPNTCLLLLHPFDRRDSDELRSFFTCIEARFIPYIHVQCASVFGRITNWFGREFRVHDTSATRNLQATVSSLGFEPFLPASVVDEKKKTSADAAGYHYDDDHKKRREHLRFGPFLTVVPEDVAADALSGQPINEGDTFRLHYTGSDANTNAFAQQLKSIESAAGSSAFVIRSVETVVCPVSKTKSTRFFFGPSSSSSASSSVAGCGAAEKLLEAFCVGGSTAIVPLRLAQLPPSVTISEFDTERNHNDGIDSGDTALLFRALTRFGGGGSSSSSSSASASSSSFRCPGIHSSEDADAMARELFTLACSVGQDNTPALLQALSPELSLLVRQFARTAVLQPVFFASYLGAFVAQEMLKFFTQKWVPMSAPMCFDMKMVLPLPPLSSAPASSAAQDDAAVSAALIADPNDYFRPDAVSAPRTPDIHLSALFGTSQLDHIRSARIFLVGAGALGCEYMKAFALMGLCSSGRGALTLTDDDNIATSNLSRQLLFRTEHVGQNKSAIAADAAKKMASVALKHAGGTMICRALQLKLEAKSTNPSSGVFNHRFWTQQTVLVGGVDNVKARGFMSEMSQQHLIPLVDGGTNGALGHVAAIIPFVTAPLQPPEQDRRTIPVCTLHFFPTTVAHCSHHALNQFRGMFGESVPIVTSGVGRSGENKKAEFEAEQEEQQQHSKNTSSKQPTLADALRRSLSLFFPLFVQPLLDLRKAKPPGALEPDGVTPYYSPQSSRRCPSIPEFDPFQDEAQAVFLCSCARLWLRSLRVTFNEIEQTAEQVLAEMIKREGWYEKIKMQMLSYVPKAANIPGEQEGGEAASSALSDDADGSQQQQQPQQGEQQQPLSQDGQSNQTQPQQQAASPASSSSSSSPSSSLEKAPITMSEAFDFEKDDDDHLDFVWASTVIRARCYAIFAPTKSDVQRIAGQMVPALITTTAGVVAAGLYNVVALLLHHNPSSSSSSSSSGGGGGPPGRRKLMATAPAFASVLSSVMSQHPHQLQHTATMVKDYMFNLADGPNSVFAFEQVLDPKNVDLEQDVKWCRPCCRVKKDDSLYTVGALVEEILWTYANRLRHWSAKLAASGKRNSGSGSAPDWLLAMLNMLTTATGGGKEDDDGSTSLRSNDNNRGSGISTPQALSKCAIVLKLRIGVVEATVFQQTPLCVGGGGGGGSSSQQQQQQQQQQTGRDASPPGNSSSSSADDAPLHVLPAHMLITAFLKKQHDEQQKDEEEDHGGSGDTDIRLPPFVESELFVQPPRESLEHELPGLSVFARLMI